MNTDANTTAPTERSTTDSVQFAVIDKQNIWKPADDCKSVRLTVADDFSNLESSLFEVQVEVLVYVVARYQSIATLWCRCIALIHQTFNHRF